MSKWHEVRLCGLLILVSKFEKLATKLLANNAEAARRRDEILSMYLQYAERANNWDLVDLSTHKILGNWLLLPTFLGGGELDMHEDYKVQVMDELAASPCLWKQRAPPARPDAEGGGLDASRNGKTHQYGYAARVPPAARTRNATHCPPLRHRTDGRRGAEDVVKHVERFIRSRTPQTSPLALSIAPPARR